MPHKKAEKVSGSLSLVPSNESKQNHTRGRDPPELKLGQNIQEREKSVTILELAGEVLNTG